MHVCFQVFNEAIYAGNKFKTKGSQDVTKSKTDDSNIRYEYMDPQGVPISIYGTIMRLFEHTMYPDGTFRSVGVRPIVLYSDHA